MSLRNKKWIILLTLLLLSSLLQAAYGSGAAEYEIEDVFFDGSSAFVKLENAEACVVAVNILDGEKSIGIGIGKVGKQAGVVTVPVQIQQWPAYYQIRCFLLDETHTPLCSKYAAGASYIVEHYQENPEDTGYTLYEVEHLHLSANETATAQPRTYAGFTCDETCENTILTCTGAENEIPVLRLFYKRNLYTATFEIFGWTTTECQKYGSILTAPDFPVDSSRKTAWNHSVPETVPAEDTSYKAISLSPEALTVYFYENGGGTLPMQALTRGDLVSRPMENLTKPGFVFDGWYADAALTVPYDFDTAITEDLSLFAKWTESVDICFDPQGGYTAMEQKHTSVGSTYGTLPIATRIGYRFTGWYTEPEGGEPVKNDTQLSRDSTHWLYAHWSTNSLYLAGREGLTEEENAEVKLRFYDALSNLSLEFAESNANIEADLEGVYSIGSVDLAQMGISEEDALRVWLYFYYDHPEYYWLCNIFALQETSMNLAIHGDYAAYSARQVCDGEIQEFLLSVSQAAFGLHSEMDVARTVFDLILSKTAYTYMEDGETPEKAAWAHNVIGPITGAGAVCEGYADAFILALRHLGINAILAAGKANDEGHAWNMAELDGVWYWFDLTWADGNERPDYQWFAATEERITAQHEVFTPQGTDGEVLYPLPQAQKGGFQPVDLYLDGMYIGFLPTLDAALSSMTEKNGNYTVVINDYFQTVASWFIQFESVYRIGGDLPVVSSISFFGDLIRRDMNSGYSFTLYVEDSLTVHSDILIKGLIVADTAMLNSELGDGVIYLGSNTLTVTEAQIMVAVEGDDGSRLRVTTKPETSGVMSQFSCNLKVETIEIIDANLCVRGGTVTDCDCLYPISHARLNMTSNEEYAEIHIGTLQPNPHLDCGYALIADLYYTGMLAIDKIPDECIKPMRVSFHFDDLDKVPKLLLQDNGGHEIPVYLADSVILHCVNVFTGESWDEIHYTDLYRYQDILAQTVNAEKRFLHFYRTIWKEIIENEERIGYIGENADIDSTISFNDDGSYTVIPAA